MPFAKKVLKLTSNRKKPASMHMGLNKTEKQQYFQKVAEMRRKRRTKLSIGSWVKRLAGIEGINPREAFTKKFLLLSPNQQNRILLEFEKTFRELANKGQEFYLPTIRYLGLNDRALVSRVPELDAL